jgi:hypothetical protein
VDETWEEAARSAEPLAFDDDIEDLPSNLEELAFVRGDKPVLYLVVPNHEVDALRSKYSGATLVCRDTPLAVESATGRRFYESSSGQTNTHVFVSVDAALAERAAKLWEEGSSKHAAAIGELMGYPSCCVSSFVALGERGNNAALTYVTAARSLVLKASFHGVLNTAVRRVVPFTPCSFGCSRGVTFAERVLGALPEHVAKPLRRALGRPVLYFDEARAVVFDGARVDERGIEFGRARYLPASAPLETSEELFVRRLFGALFAGPGRLVVKANSFEVQSNGAVRVMGRAAPRLGVVLPFR